MDSSVQAKHCHCGHLGLGWVGWLLESWLIKVQSLIALTVFVGSCLTRLHCIGVDTQIGLSSYSTLWQKTPFGECMKRLG